MGNPGRVKTKQTSEDCNFSLSEWKHSCKDFAEVGEYNIRVSIINGQCAGMYHHKKDNAIK